MGGKVEKMDCTNNHAMCHHCGQCKTCADNRLAAMTERYENRSPTEWAYNQACKALARHKSRLSLAVEGLEAVEWVQVPSSTKYMEVDYVCVWHCGGTREAGHKSDCQRQTILSKLSPGGEEVGS